MDQPVVRRFYPHDPFSILQPVRRLTGRHRSPEPDIRMMDQAFVRLAAGLLVALGAHGGADAFRDLAPAAYHAWAWVGGLAAPLLLAWVIRDSRCSRAPGRRPS